MTGIEKETNTTDTDEAQISPAPKPKFDAKAYHRKYYRERLKGTNIEKQVINCWGPFKVSENMRRTTENAELNG